MSVIAAAKLGQVVGVRFAGRVERAVVIEDRGVLGGRHVFRVRLGDRGRAETPEIELPAEDLVDVRWLVVDGPQEMTEKGRDGRVFGYRLEAVTGQHVRDVTVVVTGTYLALSRHRLPEVRNAAMTAGRAAVDDRLIWLEPPLRILVSSAGAYAALPDDLDPGQRDALRRLQARGYETHVREDLPDGFVLSDGRAPTGWWALLRDDGAHHEVTGCSSPGEAADGLLHGAGVLIP